MQNLKLLLKTTLIFLFSCSVLPGALAQTHQTQASEFTWYPPYGFGNGGDYGDLSAPQLVFGWHGGNNYVHWISTRHDANTGYRNAIDFHLWVPGAQTNQNYIGGKLVMSITGRGVGVFASTLTSGYSFQVGGNVLIEGNIDCEGVDVKQIGADYVFNKDYKMPTLWELEQFIKQNKRLPGIPPASETKKGINLAEFNTKLLEKVEQLTLYTIQQEKEISVQQKEIDELKEILQKLTAGSSN